MNYFIQHNWYFITIAAMSGGGLLYLSLKGAGGKSLTAAQATQLINRENAVVVDVSEQGEYESGHLPESRNIPSGQIADRAAELEKYKDTPLILVCQNGVRSLTACKKLDKLGFSRVHSLDGGVSGWRTAGLPVRKGMKK